MKNIPVDLFSYNQTMSPATFNAARTLAMKTLCVVKGKKGWRVKKKKVQEASYKFMLKKGEKIELVLKKKKEKKW